MHLTYPNHWTLSAHASSSVLFVIPKEPSRTHPLHPLTIETMGNPHHRKATLHLLALVAAALLTLPAKAIIVRGTVTTPFGVPLGDVRVQLIQGKGVAAFAFTQMDGTYEIRSAAGGRF